MKEFRIEEDTLGKIEILEGNLWGAQTERSFRNFKIGNDLMPKELIYALAVVKKAAAYANFECNILSEPKRCNIEIYEITGKKGTIGAVAAIGCFDLGVRSAGIPEDFE